MKMSPFIKSLIGFCLLSFLLFFISEWGGKSEFSWIDQGIFDANSIFKNLVSHLVFTLTITFAFTLPFYFFKKIGFDQFILFNLSLAIFIIFSLIFLANSYFTHSIAQLWIDYLPFEFNGFAFAFLIPSFTFLISKIHISTNRKLYFLLLGMTPFAGLAYFIISSFLGVQFTRSISFLSLTFFPLVISIIYIYFFYPKTEYIETPDDGDILDSNNF